MTANFSAQVGVLENPRNSQSGQGAQYLTLKLGDEEYAINILSVKEIRTYEEPTKMVNSPPFIKGVVNLRGVIVPIVDLRLKFHLNRVDYTEFTIVIVLNINGIIIGAVVDSVADVVTLASEQIKPSPQFESSVDSKFITGLANLGNRMLIVMNMNELMTQSELGIVIPR